jgi:hypothetical protein
MTYPAGASPKARSQATHDGAEVKRLRTALKDLRTRIKSWQVLGHRAVWQHASPDPAWSEAQWRAYRTTEAACAIGPCSLYNEAIRAIDDALGPLEPGPTDH